MYQNALLKAEVQIFRQANETLSKRRKAKRSRLRKGGKMTLDEGMDKIDQKEVNAQVVAELWRSDDQGRSERLRERICGDRS